MNIQNLDLAIDGEMAKQFLVQDKLNETRLTEAILRSNGYQETEVPKERVSDIKAFADQLKNKGKSKRAIRRAVAKKFNITIID